jgi:putative ABC transport system permease protein
MERTMESTSFFIFFFTAIISIGVVYNTAMIALSERNYELGSLRILGFHLNEVFFILIAELSMQVFLAIPIGCFFGLKMAGLVINMNDTEVFRFPAIIGVRTYLSAIATIIFTSILSFVIIYFKLKKMDLLSVLKVRE